MTEVGLKVLMLREDSATKVLRRNNRPDDVVRLFALRLETGNHGAKNRHSLRGFFSQTEQTTL